MFARRLAPPGHCKRTLPLRLRPRLLHAGGRRTFEIKAGDAIFFPPNSRGIWDVRETIRKTYVTFNP